MNGRATIVVLAIALLVTGLRASGAPMAVEYGKKVRYRENVALRFKDFELVYTGKHRVVPKQYPRGWWVYDFIVRSSNKEQKLSWSAGTGAIEPTRFEVDGKKFQLERGLSEKGGQLAEDELIVSEV